ncbi:hypothetical protein ACSV4D_14310 [Flavobacterium sp. ARAG 55.4]|uniref:hypothetical protein n=1 Tax=Flavobacterium sp. ARAG 55.4 TaxID=3451357 RepID=UPI003F48241B
MKVTFDSNTWRKVASPDNFPKDPFIQDYRKIREAINDSRIIPFISETVFTLEAIRKIDRKKFFKDYKAEITTDITETEDGQIKMSFKIGPNENAHPGNNEFLKEHFANAAKLGFNIINLPRVAGITNKDIESLKYKMSNEKLTKYLDKVFEVGARITELKAGDYEINRLGLKYNPEAGMHGIGDAPDSENGNIAKAVAEWADGDSVASHIAIGGDYFCTNDQAVSGGSNSVFSIKNLKVLNDEYDFKTVTPTELAKML